MKVRGDHGQNPNPMIRILLRLASRLDERGQYDLADRMERLASIHDRVQQPGAEVPFTMMEPEMAEALAIKNPISATSKLKRFPLAERAVELGNELYLKASEAAKLVANGTPMEDACQQVGLKDVPTMHALWRHRMEALPGRQAISRRPTAGEQRAMSLLVKDFIEQGFSLPLTVNALMLNNTYIDKVKRLMISNLTPEEIQSIEAITTTSTKPTARQKSTERLIQTVGSLRLQGYTTPQIAAKIGKKYDDSSDLQAVRNLIRDFSVRNPEHAEAITAMAKDESKIGWPEIPQWASYNTRGKTPYEKVRQRYHRDVELFREQMRSPDLRPPHWPVPGEVVNDDD